MQCDDISPASSSQYENGNGNDSGRGGVEVVQPLPAKRTHTDCDNGSRGASNSDARAILRRVNVSDLFQRDTLPHLCECLLVMVEENRGSGAAMARALLRHLASTLADDTRTAPLAAAVRAGVAAAQRGRTDADDLLHLDTQAAVRARQLLAHAHACTWAELEALASGGRATDGGQTTLMVEQTDDTVRDVQAKDGDSGDDDDSMGCDDLEDGGRQPCSKRVKNAADRARVPSHVTGARRDQVFAALRARMAAEKWLPLWAGLLPRLAPTLAAPGASGSLARDFQRLLLKLVTAIISHTVRYRVQAVLDTLAVRRNRSHATAGFAADRHTVVRQLAHYIILNDLATLRVYCRDAATAATASSLPGAEGSSRGSQPGSLAESRRRRSMLAVLEGIVHNAPPPPTTPATQREDADHRAAILAGATLDVVVLRFFHKLESAFVAPRLQKSRCRDATRESNLLSPEALVQAVLRSVDMAAAWQAVVARSASTLGRLRAPLLNCNARALMMATLAHRYFVLRVRHDGKVQRLSSALQRTHHSRADASQQTQRQLEMTKQEPQQTKVQLDVIQTVAAPSPRETFVA
jgi:hypothetical protein